MLSRVKDVFVGGPKTLVDAGGVWRSSIRRDRSPGPVILALSGIVGDAVAQPYHGGPDAALCVHLADHYRFWRERYGVELPPGEVGENLTISDLVEGDVCVGDVIRLGSALAQVSGPRVPCANLSRHIGRADWVRLTVKENRTGFYMRVLEPGTLSAGDPWQLEERLHADISIPEINRCMYLDFDPTLARRMLSICDFGEWWREQARQKLVAREEHWTSRVREE